MTRVISLFSGAGFLDFGFTENGFDIVWGAELETNYAEAHNYNTRFRYGINENRIQNVDIQRVNPRDIRDIIGPQGIRGIIGGPPCQDFSIGNANNPGVDGDRGRLVWDFLRKVAYLQPDFFLFENVDGLYKNRRHREEALNPILEIFDDMRRLTNYVDVDFDIESLGYEVYFQVLNALEYGIPQDRSRVFIIGFKKEIIRTLENNNRPVFDWPVKTYPDAKTSYNWPDQWPFGNDMERTNLVPYELTVDSVIHNQEELRRLPNNVHFNAKSNKFHTVYEGDTSRKSFKRLHRFRYSPTVAYGNNEVHLHPTEPRRLTVREALRLQSVPDWYEFPHHFTLTDMFKMVSNGVPFDLASLLAQQIQTVLNNYDVIRQHAETNRIPTSLTQ